MPELIAEIADRILILKDGEILAFDTLDGLQRMAGIARQPRPGAGAPDLPRDDAEPRPVFRGLPGMRRLFGRFRMLLPPAGYVVLYALVYLLRRCPC